MKPQKRDSGVDFSGTEKFVRDDGKKGGNMRIKNKKASREKISNGNDMNFKSGMIFDLEM